MIAFALLALAAQPADVTLAEDYPQLALSVSWPAAADAIAPLSAYLRRDARMRATRATAAGRQAEAAARRGRYPFAQHSLTVVWQVEGSTPQLFSLSAVISAYTGGGHSSDGFDALLWDRSTNRPVDPYRLFPALGARFCAAYPEALAAHGGAPSANQEQCPGLHRRPLSPADRDGNGRFETLRALVATGYFDAEGFSVDIQVEPSDIARLPEAYRSAFELLGERRQPLPDE